MTCRNLWRSALYLGACILWAGCASLGFGNTEHSGESSAQEVEAAQYLAERGVAAARQIAMATASQSIYQGEVRATSSEGSPSKRRIVRRSPSESENPTEGDGTTGAENTGDSASFGNSGERRRLERKRTNSNSSVGSTTDEGSTVIEPGISNALVPMDDASARQKIADAYDIEPPAESAIAIEGTFRQSNDLPSNQLAIIEPGHEIRVYAEGRAIASLTLGTEETSLPEAFGDVSAVRVVRDGTLQIMSYWAEPDPGSDRRTIHVGIFKVIGDHVGTIFERVVAEQSGPESEPDRRGYVDVLRGDRHRYLRWTPADEAGARVDEEAVVLHWNKWEGVFRRPVPPPTAPSPKS